MASAKEINPMKGVKQMTKSCKQIQKDITDYARGAYQYIKDYDVLFDHP